MFEVKSQLGDPVVLALLDRRVLLTLEQVIVEVRHAMGVNLTSEDLLRMGDYGWIPILSKASDVGVEFGTPLYVPSRVELFLKLEKNKYSRSELQAIAKYEEAVIDLLLDTENLHYIDDDLQAVIWLIKKQLCEADKLGKDAVLFDLPNEPVRCSELKRRLSIYERFEKEGVPKSYQDFITKFAFSIRGFMESCRINPLRNWREEIWVGYSPFIIMNPSAKWCTENSMYEPQGINWDATIKVATGYAEDDVSTIRVPGFLLRGETVVSLKTLPPRQYQELWNRHGLDQYLLRWAVLQGEKRCLHCLSKLSNIPSSRRMYCDEKCRNALKQKRFRLNNPQASFETQRKYWSTIDN